MKKYTFSQLSEKAKQNAVFSYAVKINPWKSEYDVVCELCNGYYRFDSKGNIIE